MIRCDALVVGGGPAGSTCARALRRAGWDVVVADRARFPRDKVCAGWLTPEVFGLVELDPAEYRDAGLTLQEITRLSDRRARRVAARNAVPTRGELRDSPMRVRQLSAAPVRRACARGHACRTPAMDRLDLDCRRGDRGADPHWRRRALLPGRPTSTRRRRRSDTGCRQGGRVSREPARSPRRPARRSCISAGISKATGGVSPRAITSTSASAAAIAATSTAMSASSSAGSNDEAPSQPAARSAGAATPIWRRALAAGRWSAPGVLTIGDAAGLAYPESGEGIRPAIESGRLAAQILIEAGGRQSLDDLQPYATAARAPSPALVGHAGLAAIGHGGRWPRAARVGDIYPSRRARPLVPSDG